MNPIQSNVSSILNSESGRTIRDTIFYFEDLMGPSSTHQDPMPDRSDLSYETLVDRCFDEEMIDENHSIVSPKREETIRDLLTSIEDFRKHDFEE